VFEPPTIEQEIQKDNELKTCTINSINIQLEQLRADTYAIIIKSIQNQELLNHI